MDKIPFEDGTLVKAGYVEIDGTKHETVQPEYTGNTPLSAYNMNKMQDNIEDSINEEKLVKRINISGASKQDTREGDNLLNIEDYASTTGAIINSITSEVIDITSPTGLSYESTLYFENIKLEAGKTYTIQRIITTKSGTKSNSTGQIELYLGGTWKKVILGASSTKNTFTVDETSTYRTRLYVAPANTSDAFTITVSNFMIYEGTEIKEYEQYGASPSIEFEAPIESVGDNINLIDINSLIEGYVKDGGECSTTSQYGEMRSDFLKVKPNTQYTFKIHETSGKEVSWIGIGEYSSNEISSYISRNVYSPSKYVEIASYTITTSNTTQYVIVSSRNLIGATKIKFEEGQATPYSPYGQGSIEIKNVNKNILELYDIAETTKNGLTYSCINGKIKINGTATALTNIWFNDLDIKMNEGQYTFSSNTNLQGKGSVALKDLNGNIVQTNLNAHAKITLNKNTTATQFLLQISSGATFTNFEMEIQLEKGSTATDYVPHQSQTKALYTQQPFRAIGDVRDRFVKQNGVWYEEHNIKRYVFNGEENWNMDYGTSLFASRVDNQCTTNLGLSNYFTFDKRTYGMASLLHNEFALQPQNNSMFFKNTNVTTVEDWQALLVELYEAGTPLYVDYLLAEPLSIPCTPEQVEVLNDIYSAYANGLTNIICNDEIEPVIEIVKESKETVQSENNKAISALLERVSQLEQLVASMHSTTVEEG